MELIDLLPRNFTLTPLAFDQIGAARNIKNRLQLMQSVFVADPGLEPESPP